MGITRLNKQLIVKIVPAAPQTVTAIGFLV
jgi:hypothetical protein